MQIKGKIDKSFIGWVGAAVVLAATLAATAACDDDLVGPFPPSGIVQGSGVVATESRDVAGFSGVSLRGVTARLIIEQTGTESLTITADDNLLPLLTSDVVDSRLILGGVTISAGSRRRPRSSSGLQSVS